MTRMFPRVLGLVFKYRFLVAASLIFSILYAGFSAASVALIGPFMRTLFSEETSLVMDEGSDRYAPGDDWLKEKKEIIYRAIDRLISGRSKKENVGRLCILILVIYFFKNVFSYAQGYLMAHVEQGVARDLRDRLYRHYQRLSLAYFHRHKTGHIISRVTNDVWLVNEALNASLITLFREPVTILGLLAIMILIDWQLTLLVLLVAPLSFVAISRIGRKLRKYSIRTQEKMADITAVLQETISGIRIVKAFGMEDFEIKKFRHENTGYFRNMMKLFRVRRLASPITEFLSVCLGVSILWYGGLKVIRGTLLAPEEFLTFLITLFVMMQPARRLSDVHMKIQVGLAAASRIFEVLDTKPDIVSQQGAIEVKDVRDGITYENVSFSYYSRENVLKDISFTVKVGETLALAGPSGGGKSTLVDLLPRFFEPQEGKILVDNVNIRDISMESLRALFGIVTQEMILFNDTVRANIAYGRPDIPLVDIQKAARAANAHEFIMAFPDGYDTVVGDRGLKLSGGQKQRIVIARAILKNPPILIFDEATSALDYESEILVQKAIENLTKGRTSFIIAHRLSTIKNATRILVIQDGWIVQEGTHEELCAQEGLYRNLTLMESGDPVS